MAIYNWFVTSINPLGVFADVGHNMTGFQWTEEVVLLPAAPAGSTHGTQHRVQWLTTGFISLYHITAPGVGSAADPPDWHNSAYGIFPSGADGKWSAGWSLLGPDDPLDPTAYSYNGVQLLVSEDRSPYQASRFADTDGVGVGLSAASGGSTTHLTGTFSVGQPGYHVVVRPDTAQEETRAISLRVANRVDWVTPLVNGAVTAGTQFMIRGQRTVVDQRPAGHFTGGPRTVRYRIDKVGQATAPTGNLWRDWYTGNWKSPLPGAYSVWKLSNEFDGRWRDVALFYLSSPVVENANVGSSGGSILMEFHHYQNDNANDPSNLNNLANQPSDIRYSNIRIRDNHGLWHAMMDWKCSGWFTHASENPTTELNWGWDVSTDAGKIRHQAGLATGEKATDEIFLAGLTYEDATTRTALPFVGVLGRNEGAVYTGPLWGSSGASPYIMQDNTRGWYIINPNAGAAMRLVHVADTFGRYTFEGDFALANTSNTSGGGADVKIVSSGQTLFSAHCPVGTIDPDDPWSSVTNKHFSVTKALAPGLVTYFTVSTVAAGTGFDATAFRLTVTHTEQLDSDITGWGGHRGTAGHDRAVRCPRCGLVLKEADLVVDGVTRTQVCVDCYDVPTPPPNFRWPFRT